MIYKSEKLSSIAEKVDEYISSYLRTLKNVQAPLLGAMNYAILPGGKRIRPVILVLFYELFSGQSSCIYSVAAALEMMHTYSLIHDDLPCMDNDTFRRGKKCSHLVFGEDIALLSGDAFITQSFEVLLNHENINEFGTERLLKCAKILAECAGASGMVSGQTADIKMQAESAAEDAIIDMYKNKTGKLFSAAAQMGVVCAAQDKSIVELAQKYGENLGMAFQLLDDIIDMEQDGLFQSKKITYTSVFGQNRAFSKLSEFLKNANNCLESIGGGISFLKEVTDLIARESIQQRT